MPDITMVQPDGSAQGFEAPSGVSLMQAATGFGVAGMLAECGGEARCATCHVYFDADWAARLPPALPDELALLEVVAAERLPGSRLSCQIRLHDGLQGLVARLPERQL